MRPGRWSRALRAVCLTYAVAWPGLHLLLWLPLSVELPLRAGATEGAAAALLALALVFFLGALGTLAVAWPLRLWGARERAGRRRAAAWCAGLALAYAALLPPAWVAGPSGEGPPPETWLGEALGGLGAVLYAAAMIVGLPFALLTDGPGLGAALYVGSALVGAALSLLAGDAADRRDAPGASG